MKKALLVIDVQNDYFATGGFPLWNVVATAQAIAKAMQAALAQKIPIVLIQHIANPANGPSPFFNAGTDGVEIHASICAVAPDAPVVIKRHADGFFDTNLEETLSNFGVDELLICGMMTQNCVTHTAISKSAEKYKVSILADCCTTVSEMLHKIALSAVKTRLTVTSSGAVFGADTEKVN